MSVSDEKIKCEICGAEDHLIQRHLDKAHPEVTLDEYKVKFPQAPIMSELAKSKLANIKSKKSSVKQVPDKSPFHEVFGIPKKTPGALNKRGGEIPIVKMKDSDDEFSRSLVPSVDDNYVFNVNILKEVVMGLECNIPTYAFGMAGTGKSTLFEQVCARTNRPMFRVQHSGNTEESHVLGQILVKSGETYWEPGPLQLAMKNGLTYLADEYDRAMPQVLSVYQPVLEGKALITKEAPPEWRIIKPHPDFRFVATGNTNGSGDATGLFPSAMLQDFANYERFSLMIEVGWMPEKQETAVVQGQANIPEQDAKKLVSFAKEVRKQVDAGEIGAPVSPRALIAAGKIGIRFENYRRALTLCYMNRLPAADAEVCDQVAQRFFG